MNASPDWYESVEAGVGKIKEIDMNKFEKFAQTQAPKRRIRRTKLGKRRTSGVTAVKKSKARAGVTEYVLKLEAENRSLRAEIKDLKT